MKINISKADKAAILAALYNNSKAQGMGWFQFVPGDMLVSEAATILENQTHFDYLRGRIMKVDLSGDAFDPWLYDRDNGEGAAASAVHGLNVTLDGDGK